VALKVYRRFLAKFSNFNERFYKNKKVKKYKMLKNVKNVARIKKRKNVFFYIYGGNQ